MHSVRVILNRYGRLLGKESPDCLGNNQGFHPFKLEVKNYELQIDENKIAGVDFNQFRQFLIFVHAGFHHLE